jgi:hypothetical protein
MMALIYNYKKPLHAILDKFWNKKNLPKDTYKLQIKDPCYKLNA